MRVAEAIAEIAEQRRTLGISSVTITTKSDKPAAPGDSEGESDAEVARVERGDSVADEGVASAPFDEDGPAWPSAADEAAFIDGEKEQGRTLPQAGAQTLRQAAEQSEAALGPLPSIDALIERLPARTREMLEDLFRPKFTGVKRVSPDALK